jgi:DNA-binding CsgD family transcriptional regulator
VAGGARADPRAALGAGYCRTLSGSPERCTGDVGAALGAAREAAHVHSVLEQPFEFARTLLIKGRVARRAKKKRVARDALEQAREIFDRLDAALWSKQALEELARIGGRAPSGTELTPTEERVAALVAEGHANREVASALYVSENTIESHLTHIYAKLGVHSRTELGGRITADGRSRTKSS